MTEKHLKDLKKFWRECPLDKLPYLHPCDEEAKRHEWYKGGYAEYVNRFKNNELSDKAFHLGLLPQPYHGDLANAEVIILLKNPGFDPLDYVAEEQCPKYRDAIRKTIHQELGSHMFLDPKWSWTGGFKWWEPRLREVAQRISENCFNKSYGDALTDLAKKVACLELVPYHSKSCGGTTCLASKSAIREFAKKVAEDRERTVVVARAVKDWGVRKRCNVRHFSSGQARSAWFGPGSAVGKAILKCYGLEPSQGE
ncbi:MAG: hypothetical protein OXJ53_09150 [Gammaproteobacteria bacterium]|nr:hypothetical protein [Gammaproteobacteria bacterium]